MPTRPQRPSVWQLIGGDHPNIAVIVGVILALRIRPVHIGREQSVIIKRSDPLLVIIVKRRSVLFDAPGYVDGSQVEIVLGVGLPVGAIVVGNRFELLVFFRELNADRKSTRLNSSHL